MVKVPEGELKAPEIRRMIKAHNKLMGIEIPKGTDRAGLIKLVEKNGYKVDHKAKKLVPSVKMKRKPTVKLPPEPAKKTKEEKEKAKKERVIKKKAKDEEGYQKVKKQVDAVKKIGEKRKARLEKVPKGSHRMPDGSIMKDKDMPKKKEMGTQTGDDKKEPPKKKETPRERDDKILKADGRMTLTEYQMAVDKIRDGKPLDDMNMKQKKDMMTLLKKASASLTRGGFITVSADLDGNVVKKKNNNDIGNLERKFGFLATRLKKEKAKDNA